MKSELFYVPFRLVFPCCLVAFCSVQLIGQSPVLTPEQAHQRTSDIVKYLASDELQGRGVETKGLEIAGEFVENEFKSFGLQAMPDGSYRQYFDLDIGSPALNEDTCNLTFERAGQVIELELDKDFAPQIGRRSTSATGGLVFVGYGIKADEFNYDEYRNIDVNGKFLIVIRKEPQQNDANSVFNGTDNSDYAFVQYKVDTAREAGAVGILFVNDAVTAPTDAEDKVEADRNRFNVRGRPIPFAHVTRSSINRLLEKTPVVAADGTRLINLSEIEARIDASLEPLSAELGGWNVNYQANVENKVCNIFNVVGLLPGSGPNKDEYMVIGGHYDHLGYGGYGSMAPGRTEIHPGADDNATGTAAVIELARRFAALDKVNRSMIFVAFTGEERGLHGSRHYVDNPPWPLEKTVYMINFDMIGYLRNKRLDLIHGESGTGMAALFRKSAAGLDLDLAIGNSAQPNSDHYSFYAKKIPDVFIHTGITRVLHTPEDTFEALDMYGAMKVIDFTENLIRNLDELETAPEFVDLSGQRRQRTQSSLGAQIDFEADGGPTVQSIVADSAAEKAGLQRGDILIYFNTTKVTGRSVVVDLLRDNPPGTKIEVKVNRNGEVVVLNLELGGR
ncbi:MAG TPA: M28 family peptidase [Pirellulaceae bacterium]|nr:M28 family peptidase [Pirellulaceae bacterium]HMO91481.1 M28 family peptidase [Pirellulaceae bacterium]HMP70994.1 M28 family peptidase [Pirellulaceae bacterium]